MTRPRSTQVSLADTPYYHRNARCVRRAFLCGIDPFSGQNYEHRREWLVTKMKSLASIFSMDICAYAVMSNHYHLILRVDAESATAWTQREVIDRWTKLFSMPVLVERYLRGQTTTDVTRDVGAIASPPRAQALCFVGGPMAFHDVEPNPPLTRKQRAAVERLSPAQVRAIDEALQAGA